MLRKTFWTRLGHQLLTIRIRKPSGGKDQKGKKKGKRQSGVRDQGERTVDEGTGTGERKYVPCH